MRKWNESADTQAVNFQASPVLSGDQSGYHGILV